MKRILTIIALAALSASATLAQSAGCYAPQGRLDVGRLR